MNLANWLTLFRLLLVPIFTFAVLLDVPGGPYIGAVVFTIASITDGLDGYIARARKEVTRFGKLMDPIADKLLITAALLCLVQLGKVTAWPALLIIGREFAVSGLRMIAASDGIIISASKWGKVKTVSQIIMVLALLLQRPWADLFLWLTVVVTVISGVHYFLQAQDILRSSMK
ncbi:MAG: CDP-diacylglycerol--glycerol-3-phosphate 3-phosphatidyltransferase [Firmicutes bacterium]|nr:CDP-diacylglycerol--glycerol-3-phosphate 3-phosphatidyltransferase [Bacillota bacterium]